MSASQVLTFLILFFMGYTQALAQDTSTADVCTRYPQPSRNTTFPSRHEICQIFAPLTKNLSDEASFATHISPTVQWTIEGTHPLAGLYPNRTLFVEATARISACQDPAHPWRLELINIIGGGEEEWSTVELHIFGPTKSGLVFDNRYAWVLRWNRDRQIVEARAYLDSALITAAITENEIGSKFTYTDVRAEALSYTTLSEEQLKNATGFQVQV